MSQVPYLVACWIFLVGLYGVATSRNLIHLVVCLSVVQSATYVLLLSIGYVAGGSPPIFIDRPVGPPTVDPVVQALTLTDIVVGATATALLLAIAVEIRKATGTLDPEELAPLRMPGRTPDGAPSGAPGGTPGGTSGGTPSR